MQIVLCLWFSYKLDLYPSLFSMNKIQIEKKGQNFYSGKSGSPTGIIPKYY